MILKELHIEQIPSYKDNAGQYEGSVKFTGGGGDVLLRLTPEQCNQIFRICADGILATAREAAENLTCNVLEHQKLLEEGGAS